MFAKTVDLNVNLPIGSPTAAEGVLSIYFHDDPRLREI